MLEKCAAMLQSLTEQGGTLRIVFARGQNDVRLGLLYASLAGGKGSSAAASRDYWRQARASLESGVASLQQLTARVAIEPIDMAVLDAGIAGLARAHAALADIAK